MVDFLFETGVFCRPHAVSYGELFCWGSKQIFSAFNVDFEPDLLGMSLTTLGEVPRSMSRLSSVADARIWD